MASYAGGEEKQESSHAYRIAPIAAIYEDCVQYFEQICTVMDSNPEAWETRSSQINDCFSKFRDWGNATKAPTRSLDHALRKSSRLQETTKDLLEDLLSMLHTSKAMISSIDKKSTVYTSHFHTWSLDPYITDGGSSTHDAFIRA